MTERGPILMVGALCGVLVRKGVLTLPEIREVMGDFAPTDDELVQMGLSLGVVDSEAEARRLIGDHS